MDEKKIEEVMAEMRSVKDELKTQRDSLEAEKRAFEQEKATYSENPGVQRQKAVNEQLRDVYNAMKEKRAITLSGAGAVEVVNELFKVFKNRTDVLNGVRYFMGSNSQTKIPVLSPRPARPSRVAEGATGISADSTAALGATSLEPETYYSELAVSFETLKYLPVDFESELVTVFADAFADAMANQMVNGTGSANHQFGGLFTQVPAANQIACKASGAPTIADIVNLALKMQEKVMGTPTICISPTLYAGISTAAVTGYEVYKNELIMNRTIEGVKVEVCGYAPTDTSADEIVAVGYDKGDYAIGIASDITIEPIRTPGSTNTYYQAIMGIDGKPIVAANLYALKAIS